MVALIADVAVEVSAVVIVAGSGGAGGVTVATADVVAASGATTGAPVTSVFAGTGGAVIGAVVTPEDDTAEEDDTANGFTFTVAADESTLGIELVKAEAATDGVTATAAAEAGVPLLSATSDSPCAAGAAPPSPAGRRRTFDSSLKRCAASAVRTYPAA